MKDVKMLSKHQVIEDGEALDRRSIEQLPSGELPSLG
jgi:hypothetical protein